MVKFSEEPPIEMIDTKSTTVVIKGLPGTGKTSLALELAIRTLPNSYYVSTRVPPSVIYNNYPWLKEKLGSNSNKPFFIDATRSNISKDKTSPNILKFDFSTITDFVQSLVKFCITEPNITVIIDSWNSLTNDLTDREVYHWESMLIRNFQRNNSRIIFVIEGESDTSIDWTADIITVLRKKVTQSSLGLTRPIRELYFDKIRGRPIQNDTYLVSLERSQFHYFRPFKYRFPALLRYAEPIEDPDDKRVSTGSAAFDNFTNGGFQRGSFNLFEVSKAIGYGLDLFIYPIITNHLNLKRPLINIFREGDSYDSKKTFLDVFTDYNDWSRYTVNFERYVPEDSTNRLVFPSDITELKELIKQVKEKLKDDTSDPVLFNIGLDTLENVYGTKKLTEILGYIISRSRVEGDIVIGWLNEDQDFKSGTIAPTSHYQINLINRALVIGGVIPATGYFACEPILSKGYVDFNMTPIL